jgi:hypothetical protein
MCVATRHNDVADANKQGETPRRQSFDEEAIDEKGPAREDLRTRRIMHACDDFYVASW